MSAREKPFWETKTLRDMTHEEWESLCDGCGKCCMVLLIDEEGGGFFETDLKCRLFDAKRRRCKNYAERTKLVSDCVAVTPENAYTLEWMPETCAYRRLANGEGLADWHPLVSGDRNSVVRAGIAVTGNPKAEDEVPEDEVNDHITRKR